MKIDGILAVSSLIEWKTTDGEYIDSDSIANLPQKDIDNLEMEVDDRYNIEELREVLEKSILNYEAQLGLKMAYRLETVVLNLAKHLTKIFAGISAAVAQIPIPIADFYVLIVVESLLVCLIAALSGRDISLDTAAEFIGSVGGIVGAGKGFRFVARQGAKYLVKLIPGVGTAVSSAIAAIGTVSIGNAAIEYYIKGKDIDAAKKKFDEVKTAAALKKEQGEREKN